MKKVLINYLLAGYFKTLLKVILFFYCFGVILNLFEEIEFFKNLNTSVLIPLKLTILYIPGMLVQLLPFIIFLSSLKFIMDIRNNRDLISMKVFGFSNFKIFVILATTSFLIGWFVLFFINPVTSVMSKYYEKTKSNFSRDIDHLVTFNKNGLWIKENLNDGQRIISAKRDDAKIIKDVTIFNFDKDFNLNNKIFSKTANIEKNEWVLNDVIILEILQNSSKELKIDQMSITSIYTYDKITSLFKNFDTLSFIDLIINYDELVDRGYNKIFLKQNLHSMLSMPFFLFIMTSLASILIMGTLKRSKNMKIVIFGLIICVLIYYLKDLSIALGQTNRIPLALASWVPIIVISMFSFVGILQINER